MKASGSCKVQVKVVEQFYLIFATLRFIYSQKNIAVVRGVQEILKGADTGAS